MMDRFTRAGRATARTPCPAAAGGPHEPDLVIASLGTFYCKACGAIAPDSEWAKEDGVGKKDEDKPKPKPVTVTCPACRGSGMSSKKPGQQCGGGCNGTGKITATI